MGLFENAHDRGSVEQSRSSFALRELILAKETLIPVCVLITNILVSYFVANYFRRTQHQVVGEQSAIVAHHAAHRIEDYVHARLLAVDALRNEVAMGLSTTEHEFVGRAGSLYERFRGVHALNWIDAKGVIQWVYPLDANRNAIGRNVYQHPVAGPFVQQAKESRAPVMTPPLDLFQGGRAFTTYFPVVGEDGELEGYVNGVFLIDRLVEASLRGDTLDNFQLYLSDRQEDVFGAKQLEGDSSGHLLATEVIHLLGREWELRLAPNVRYWESPEQTIWFSVMMSGILFSLMFSALVRNLLMRQEERSRNLKDLAAELTYEKLISSVSTNLANASIEEIEEELKLSLGKLVSFAEVDRAGIVQLSLDGRLAEVTHELTSDGIRSRANPPVSVENDDWCWSRISNGENLVVVCPEDLPSSGCELREHLLEQNVKSFLLVPAMISGQPIGCLYIETTDRRRNWTDQMVDYMTVMGELFANAINRRNIAVQIRSLQRELLQTTQLTALGEVTASVSHELNQPLTAIAANITTAQKMRADGKLGERDLDEILGDLASDNRRAAEVIREIRSLVSQQPQRLEPVDVEQTIDGVARILRAEAAHRNTMIDFHIPSGLPLVQGNVTQLQQVLLNLVGNALDAMTEIQQPSRSVQVNARIEESHVAIEVRDRGRGFCGNDPETIFDAFHTSKQGGVGLGLAICRRIVKAHGGRIWAEENHDQGATFRFTLPILASS